MRKEKRNIVLLLLFYVVAAIGMTMINGCDHPYLSYLFDDAEPVEVDTCETPILYTEPAFVTGMMIINENVTTDVVIHVGLLTDTIQPGDDMSSKLKSLLLQYAPAYSYSVYVSDTDWRRIAFIAKGTNDQNKFHGKVYLRFNNHHTGWGFQCTAQAFIFGGALNFEEYQAAIDSFPSYNYINWMDMHLDSLQYETSARKAVECQIGRYYANFTFNDMPISHEVLELYDNADWEVVRH